MKFRRIKRFRRIFARYDKLDIIFEGFILFAIVIDSLVWTYSNFKWYGLLTRNYISSDKRTGFSGFSDYRFVAIEPAEEGADIG